MTYIAKRKVVIARSETTKQSRSGSSVLDCFTPPFFKMPWQGDTRINIQKDGKNNLIDKYTYRVEWSKEDNVHIARCLEFPSLMAQGNLTLKVPPETYKQLVIKSAEEGVTLNQYILSKISQAKYSLKQFAHRPCWAIMHPFNTV